MRAILWAIFVGSCCFLGAVVAGIISFALWPSEITDTPLSQLTLGGIFAAAFSLIFLAVAFGFLGALTHIRVKR